MLETGLETADLFRAQTRLVLWGTLFGVASKGNQRDTTHFFGNTRNTLFPLPFFLHRKSNAKASQLPDPCALNMWETGAVRSLLGKTDTMIWEEMAVP